VYRRTPRLHRRLMTVAATMLLVAAAGRMTFLPLPLWLGVWALPILLAMAYEHRTQGVLHPVYLLDLAAILVRGDALRFLVDTDTWTNIVHWVLARAA
jgi:hypothetical protein